MDLWNRLNRTQTPPPPTPVPAKEDLGGAPKYAGYADEQYRPAPPQAPNAYDNGQAGSNLGSNIKIDDPDIPPFLRRKFNK